MLVVRYFEASEWLKIEMEFSRFSFRMAAGLLLPLALSVFFLNRSLLLFFFFHKMVAVVITTAVAYLPSLPLVRKSNLDFAAKSVNA